MHVKGSRCGTASRGSSGPRAMRDATRAACIALVALFACALPAAGSEPQAVAGSATIVIHGQGRVTSEPAGAIDCPGDCSHTFIGLDRPDAPGDAGDGLGNRSERLLRRDGRLRDRAERLRLHDPRLLPPAREAPGLAERRRGDRTVADTGRLAR